MKISCIMPTSDRPDFVAESVAMFMGQDYEDKELLILDAGKQPWDKKFKDDVPIHYHRAEGQLTVGAMRNKLCELSTSKIIAHWDDDDVYETEYLSVMMEGLRKTKADIVGLNRVQCLDMQSGYKFIKDMGRLGPSGIFWLIGPTLVFKREVWQARKFMDIPTGEEFPFIALRPNFKVVPVERHDQFTHRFHPACSTWKFGKDVMYGPAPGATL